MSYSKPDKVYKASIPVGLPINESTRLLCYLKAKYPQGFLNKCDIKKLCRYDGKDIRSLTSYLKKLLEEGLIGEDESSYYLRSWKFITHTKKLNIQAFQASTEDIRQKDFFESKQLA